jgi:putative spermidine/putrescine transport system permease protein
MSDKLFTLFIKISAILIIIYLLIPIFVILISAFNGSRYYDFPPTSWTLRLFTVFASRPEYLTALGVSVKVALAAVGVSLVSGVMAAFALDRYKFPGNAFLQGVFLSPLLLPQIIWAIGLIQYFALIRIGDGNLLGTFAGLVLAHSVIVLPYVIRLVLASLKFVDVDLENAAMSLGAKPIRTFFEITLPLIAPGVLVSAVFGFMISFTDVVISSFVAGSRNITFPVRIYSEMRSQGLRPEVFAISAIVVTLIVIIALVGEKTVRWSRFM